MGIKIDDGVKTIPVTNIIVSEAKIGNMQRRVIVLHNTSVLGEVISIAIGKEAKAGQGIVLSQGQSYTASMDGAYTPPQERIHALASVATATLAIHEEIEVS